MDKAYIRSVYRRLWRAAHYAVQYRKPAINQVRSKLRYTFRNETTIPSPEVIARTEQFLRTAGRRRGTENNVVKNMCFVHWSRGVRHGYFGITAANLALSDISWKVLILFTRAMNG
jgi:hypothetical protein